MPTTRHMWTKPCVNVHLNAGAVHAGAVMMNATQIILEVVLATQS